MKCSIHLKLLGCLFYRISCLPCQRNNHILNLITSLFDKHFYKLCDNHINNRFRFVQVSLNFFDNFTHNQYILIILTPSPPNLSCPYQPLLLHPWNSFPIFVSYLVAHQAPSVQPLVWRQSLQPGGLHTSGHTVVLCVIPALPRPHFEEGCYEASLEFCILLEAQDFTGYHAQFDVFPEAFVFSSFILLTCKHTCTQYQDYRCKPP